MHAVCVSVWGSVAAVGRGSNRKALVSLVMKAGRGASVIEHIK